MPIDFGKHSGKGGQARTSLDPLVMYEALDRQVDKGPLRPAQSEVLKEWHQGRRSQADVLLKLHTGQGKTLIGLLMLLSKLRETGRPALYLTPNKFLAAQTSQQAKQFGIDHVRMDKSLPTAFLDGKLLMISHVQKMFHGHSKFGLDHVSEVVDSIVIDDSHACIDAISEAFVISVKSSHQIYLKLFDLFATELQKQGLGTFEDIRQGNYGAFLPVPYWDWSDKINDVAATLSEQSTSKELEYVWPLLKDRLPYCSCIISSTGLQISLQIPDLERFGSFVRASHRVFMSATVSDDSFFAKALGLAESTINNPLTFKGEKWSGEKMILIPSLIDESLTREEIVKNFAPPDDKRPFGIVTLASSFNSTADWKGYKAIVATKADIDKVVDDLRTGHYSQTVVIVNRYDGIDLPDASCRILIIDSRPRPESLLDRYVESCRPNSDAVAVRITRAIEQGLGRSVRGEKDYSAIVLIGPELIKHVRLSNTEHFFSSQTRAQIRIGHEIADLAKDQIKSGTSPFHAVKELIGQCVYRDAGWKSYYAEQMDAMSPAPPKHSMLKTYAIEREAEQAAFRSKWDVAANKTQSLADSMTDPHERGWYLQELARYTYQFSPAEANRIQRSAHSLNTHLLKPKSGMVVQVLKVVSHKRIERLINWVRGFKDITELMVNLDDLLAQLTFGTSSERFEASLNEMGQALGFECQRPDKEWKAGPDNLWGIADGDFLVFECKNEVLTTRSEINKGEISQLNTSIAWFRKEYVSVSYTPMLIHPAVKCGPAVVPSEPIQVVRVGDLKKLCFAVRAFFQEFATADFSSLSDSAIQTWLNQHNLNGPDLKTKYSKTVV